jgi:hypothetical protein
MCVIYNPFTLDILKPALKYLEKHEESKLKGYLNIFSESDLILCSISNFFTNYEQKQIKKVFNRYIKESESGPIEMEFRIFKVGKKGKTMDKFTFYYLQDYLIKHFKYSIEDTIDIVENNTNKIYKLRSTYKNIMKDIVEGRSILNEYKNKITSYTLESKYKDKKFFNNLTFKLEIANEVISKKIIGLKSQIAGKMVNNLIRFKNRYSFIINELWKIDLTKVTSAYTLESLKDKNETFECECEYIGGNIPFELFIKSMSDIYKLILSNSNYCDTCV